MRRGLAARTAFALLPPLASMRRGRLLARGLPLALIGVALAFGGDAARAAGPGAPRGAGRAALAVAPASPTLAIQGASVLFGLRGHEPDGDPFYFAVISARLHDTRAAPLASPDAHIVITGYLEAFTPRTRPRLLDVVRRRAALGLYGVLQGQAALVDAAGRLAWRGPAVADLWPSGALHLRLTLLPVTTSATGSGASGAPTAGASSGPSLVLGVSGAWPRHGALDGAVDASPPGALATLRVAPGPIPPWQVTIRALAVPLPPMLGRSFSTPATGAPPGAISALVDIVALALAAAIAVVWWPPRRGRAVEQTVGGQGDTHPAARAPRARARERAGRPRSADAATALPASLPLAPVAGLLAVLALLCWALLVTWYGVAGHYSTVYFAFASLRGGFDAPVLRATVLIFLALALLYGGVYALLRRAARLTLALEGVIVLLILGPALANLLLYPVGALDVFNYGATLKLAYFYHQNPYLVTFSAHPRDPAVRLAFMWSMPLPYGPLGVLLGGLPAFLTGFGDPQRVVLGLKALNLLLLLGAGLLLYRSQRTARRGWLVLYLVLANPLVLFEGVGNGHNDVLMTTLLLAALLALKERPRFAPALLALSALTKFFTLALAPLVLLALWRRERDPRRLAISLALALAVTVAVCAPFWAGGRMIAGLTRGMAISENMTSASPFSLAREWLWLNDGSFAALIQPACYALFAVGALLILRAVWQGRAVEAAAIDTYLLFTLLLSLLFPWYYIAVLALLALRPTRLNRGFIFGITALGLTYYPLSVWAWSNSGLPAFGIHVFQALFLTLPILVYLGRKLRLRSAAQPARRAAPAVGEAR